MTQGTLTSWLVEAGTEVKQGDELAEVETDKIANVIEATTCGVLRRIVLEAGRLVPVGGLIGVLADASVIDSEIDRFIETASQAPVGENAGESTTLQTSNIAVGNRVLQVVRTGASKGEPIVLIHGFAGDINNWQFVIPTLALSREVIAIDLPGHGGSTRDVGDGSIGALADAIRGALAVLDVHRCHLVGHSLGGAVAASLAQADRGSIASLTLICPVGVPGTAVAAEFIRGMAGSNRTRDLKGWMEMLMADPSIIGRTMVEDMLRYKRLDGVTTALTKIGERLIADTDLEQIRDGLERIAPALIIASRNDKVVGTPDGVRLPAGIQLEVLHDVGHMPHLEAAAVVAGLIQRQIEA
jgi:pyruvate dehydrogenase E2 component (dihydrolipoamide acetyltransferase)